MSGKLIIVRHGESEWNAKGVWTGTTDVHLTAKGRHESELMGQQLEDQKIDQAFVSEQTRTSETLAGIEKALDQHIDATMTAAFNERDYGELTGQNKWQVKEKLGEEAFQGIRRGWDYPVPGGETLKDVYERAIPYYIDHVVPLILAGKNVLIVAHGNSIRSLVKYIESISDEEIKAVEMIFGTILIFDVDAEGKMIKKEIRQIETTPPPA